MEGISNGKQKKREQEPSFRKKHNKGQWYSIKIIYKTVKLVCPSVTVVYRISKKYMRKSHEILQEC